MDVVRVLSAILLLGNVIFTPGLGDDAFDVELMGKDELNSVAKLLGISSTLLWQGLTMRTHSVRGQPIQSMSDSHMVCVFQFHGKNFFSVNCVNIMSLFISFVFSSAMLPVMHWPRHYIVELWPQLFEELTVLEELLWEVLWVLNLPNLHIWR